MSVDALRLLRELVAIPSVNPMRVGACGAVERGVADHLEVALRREGIDCERQHVDEGRENLIAVIEPSATAGRGVARDGLMLCTHMDTVPTDNMSVDPFNPTLREGRVYGRGSCDAKGPMASMVAALVAHSRKSERPAPVVFAATVDEEFSFKGAWKLVEREWPVSACVIGEPTRLNLVVAHKGVARWRVSVKGRSAHGATLRLGRSAIYGGARVALSLEAYAEELSRRAAHPLLGSPTMNVGRVSGGQAVNVVPDLCEFEVEQVGQAVRLYGRLLEGWRGAALSLLFFALLLSCATPAARAQARRVSGSESERLARLIEANVVATHAYQVLLAKRSGKGDAACYSPGRLSDSELEALVAHQASLLKSDAASVRAWARGRASDFDPAKDIEPILNAGLTAPESAPVNVFTGYLRRRVRTSNERIRSVANLYQTILEVERDGDLLQDEFRFYIALGLPVYVGQFGLPGSDSAMLAAGRELAARTCASPFETDAAAWQIAGRKVWNWGEKHLHVRDEKTLAASLLRERDVRALLPRVRALPAQKIAVVGHSFTMGQHWSSPSSFVRVVTEVFRRENPRVEFKQFERGGLTASRAKERFYRGVLDWKPDKVLLVVLTRTDEDYAVLKEMGEGFKAAGIEALMFDDINDPESVKPGVGERAVRVAREAGVTVIEVGATLSAAPERERFVSLDKVHMTEPYHRLMAKEWLRFLVGAGRVGGRQPKALTKSKFKQRGRVSSGDDED